MIRIIDICFSLMGLILFLPLSILIIIVGIFDTGSPLFIQSRIGKNKIVFRLYKFRTMKVGTASKGTHEIVPSSVTAIGGILRKTKMDELPQLINVLKGDMSLVGPRPNLPNQLELINYRDQLNVYNVKPGITGLAQINEVDMSTPEKLSKLDAQMIMKFSVTNYLKIIFSTLLGKGLGDRVKLEN